MNELKKGKGGINGKQILNLTSNHRFVMTFSLDARDFKYDDKFSNYEHVVFLLKIEKLPERNAAL